MNYVLQLCYLYADLYKQTNSKETRRVFMDFHTFFMDRAAMSDLYTLQRPLQVRELCHRLTDPVADEELGPTSEQENLKVAVPEPIASELVHQVPILYLDRFSQSSPASPAAIQREEEARADPRGTPQAVCAGATG
ncbi:hypothetical protein JZ751_022720 [Albula glossodonta]|uniref:Regulator of G protein signalling-like domain-containing protein n=1 Tax=Albula glossodonta TaxID=121402 RepID=A0A8T2PH32_9TELE|nr:hypothetical protein JZ751_022720 [Albula glossodonta]